MVPLHQQIGQSDSLTIAEYFAKREPIAPKDRCTLELPLLCGPGEVSTSLWTSAVGRRSVP
jgi:hypothetical protein